MDKILEVSGLTKPYDNFSLKNITFSLPRGSITGFIGVRGAGKTAVLRSILGLTRRQSSGSVRLLGMELEGNERQIKDRVGIALENIFYDELTLFEMKCIIAPSYAFWREQDFNSYIDRFSLNLKQKIGTLSGSEEVQYALALALSHKAELLIVDEPACGFDAAARGRILPVLTEYMDNGGQGVLFSTHTASDLDCIADTVVMIDNGEIVFQQEKTALLDSYRIVKGELADLNADTRKLFQNMTETGFGFTAITRDAPKVWEYMPDAVIRRPSIEDIMLAYRNS